MHNLLVEVYPNNSDWQYIMNVTGDSSWNPDNVRRYFSGSTNPAWRLYNLIIVRVTTSFNNGLKSGNGPALTGGLPVDWVYLIVAGVFEIVWSFTMKQSQGFTRMVPTVLTFSAVIVSCVLMALSMKTIPLGTAYAVFTGIGAIGAFVMGVVILGEQLSVLRVTAAVVIIVGLLMMKLSSTS